MESGQTSKSKYSAVVAIDIGTSRSGYAFTFNDPTNITLNTFENEGFPLFVRFMVNLIILEESQKTCTALVLVQEKDKLLFRSFGNEAFCKMTIGLKDPNLHGFKYFKMKLFDKESSIKSSTGATVSVVDVISESIKVFVTTLLFSFILPLIC
jgi:hypothetical protein